MSKEAVEDSLVFQAPDGGEIKMTMTGYPKKEVERLKARLLENGWVFVDHAKKTVEVKEDVVFNKYRYILIGALLSAFLQVIFTAWVEANG